MAARKRGYNESYKAYRANLKAEEKKLNQQLRGRVLWPGQYGTAQKVIRGEHIFLENEMHRVRIK